MFCKWDNLHINLHIRIHTLHNPSLVWLFTKHWENDHNITYMLIYPLPKVLYIIYLWNWLPTFLSTCINDQQCVKYSMPCSDTYLSNHMRGKYLWCHITLLTTNKHLECDPSVSHFWLLVVHIPRITVNIIYT